MKGKQAKLTQKADSPQASHYLRAFAQALGTFHEFDGFVASLKQLVSEDPHLPGQLSLPAADASSLPDFEGLDDKECVVPVVGYEGNHGYMQFRQANEGRPFGAGDLHLMGALASMISALYSQAREYRQQKRKANIMQFLIDQLPVGIICFDELGDLLAGNNLAWRQLNLQSFSGSKNDAPILNALRDGVAENGEAHFAVDGRLMFAMKRLFESAEGEAISSYVIYDMSKGKERLIDALDRDYYKALSQGSGLCLAVLYSDKRAGSVYSKAKELCGSLNLDAQLIGPVDAYTCACGIPADKLSRAKLVLESLAKALAEPELRLSLVRVEKTLGTSPGAKGIEHGVSALRPVEVALIPKLMVLDVYRPVFETLRILLDGVADLDYFQSAGEVSLGVQSGDYDGVIVDLDSLQFSEREVLLADMHTEGQGMKVFFTSTRRKSMLCEDELPVRLGQILFKPFEAEAVVKTVRSAFTEALN
ncbi:hypothetical protein DDZ13_06280 [Coraliomargarita sinensis]|uniref:Uncharacterized protein n=1 Tax=Coraliomargarita sinensis TaxID=2174842 RepID=A0A317ZIH9_9BACT|nr:hypothetical protein [Coraliomargarita sinensis]PXA04772.1 hypothetical protein DDZ13_06280 [Coraliomargarita sinensis]